MPYMKAKGYCRKCKQNTQHRFSLTITCGKCGLVSSQEEYNKGEKEK